MTKKQNIYLTGMMGCGKSSCARRLAPRLGFSVADTDEEIVRRDGRSISDIFAQDGEAFFRDLESAEITRLSGLSGLVVATGGGAVLRPENVEKMKKSGIIVLLIRPAADIFGSADMGGRPLAGADRQAFLKRWEEREPVYRAAADIVVDNSAGVDAGVEAILASLRGDF